MFVASWLTQRPIAGRWSDDGVVASTREGVGRGRVRQGSLVRAGSGEMTRAQVGEARGEAEAGQMTP